MQFQYSTAGKLKKSVMKGGKEKMYLLDTEKSFCELSILDRVREIARRAAEQSERHL